ncbi:MAG: ATP-NAD kinase family protein [Candidatus Korarchaeota archaeon]|nr:ATP-NAD kinase family protein [Candidatus Korarchaeota archaeon]
MRRLIGLIVNPVAGLGGPAGFKGTDAPWIVKTALSRGYRPTSPIKAERAVRILLARIPEVQFVSPRGVMGEQTLKRVGARIAKVLEVPNSCETTPEDTVEAAKRMCGLGVALILFCGGDGTAADVVSAVDQRVPILGIPAGVKMFSGVFAYSPEDAGLLAAEYVEGRVGVRTAEIVDAVEDLYRQGELRLELKGFAITPDDPAHIQCTKEPTRGGDEAVYDGIAAYLAENMDPNTLYILGPGSTVSKVAARLGIEKTPLGVDVALGNRLIAKDVDARELEVIVDRHAGPVKLILTPVGGSGVLLGRGNQQISERVLERLDKTDLMVISHPAKLAKLRELRLDVNEELRARFRGYLRVVTGYREETLIRVL